jgi:mannose-6-phosphate isomerase class I
MNFDLLNNKVSGEVSDIDDLRKSTQFLMPAKLSNAGNANNGIYNIYPCLSVGDKEIHNGYQSLTEWIISQKTVIIDGYAGIYWKKIQAELQQNISACDLTVNWIEADCYLKPTAVIEELVIPFLGAEDAVWGTRCTLELRDLYEMERFAATRPDATFDINIIIGTGAALAGWDVSLIYIDLPKNELQFRMRAGSISNLGAHHNKEAYLMYKRFYFVDWVLLNAHKKRIFDKISIIADGQWPDDINWMSKHTLLNGLTRLSNSVIRVRPWFEPGAWGGQWIKEHITGINAGAVNYAWSFELIVPENGLIFESNGYLLEVSFDFLMYSRGPQVLGRHADRFGDEFPIRFDFLDTMKGGDLSIQCHPKLEYIQKNFGETITQDETYYILDCDAGAKVYLGFQEQIDPEEFHRTLTDSQRLNKTVNIENFIQVHPAKKHDLFLIPNGTVHSAGAGNLVLEISATPYIFTFKMYDWLRLDLDGNPRPINIDHAFNNLDFERKGSLVKTELIAKPRVIEEYAGFRLVHLPTHPEHFYDVHRIEFDKDVLIETNDCCHVMMLVEGQAVCLETADGSRHQFAFAETFVIPAAAQNYRLINLGKTTAKVIKAFLK